MQALTDTLLPIVNTINGYLSDYILVFLLMGAGLYFSFKTKFVQVRCFGEGMKRVFGNLTLSGKKHESGMSSFQALATATSTGTSGACFENLEIIPGSQKFAIVMLDPTLRAVLCSRFSMLFSSSS